MASGIGAVALSRVAAFFQAEGYNVVPTDPSTSAITVHVCLDLGLFCYLTHWLGFIFRRGGQPLISMEWLSFDWHAMENKCSSGSLIRAQSD
jgi:hypothetical protein